MGGFRLSPTAKADLSDRLLAYLKENGPENWPNTSAMLHTVAGPMKEQVFDLWKAFDLLIILGRVIRNNPNGKTGARVIDWTPIHTPTPADVRLCRPDRCPVLKALGRTWPDHKIEIVGG